MINETLSAEELGNKLLQSVKEMKAGKAARVSRVDPTRLQRPAAKLA
jgi:putative transcriptional regulator